MTFFLVVVLILIFCFGFVVAYGAPYLPTLGKQQQQALELLGLKPGQTMLELGSGDGRMLIATAKQGLNVVGYELNPILYFVSKIICFRYRHKIKIHLGNFWHKKWPEADAIFVFLHSRYMNKLDQKVKSRYNKKPIKLVSYAFEIPGKVPQKTEGALYLYQYN